MGQPWPLIVNETCEKCGDKVLRRKNSLICTCRRIRRLLRKHPGLTEVEVQDLYAKLLSGTCEICGQVESATREGRIKVLALDHNHSTGEVRGVLCQNCNTGLGLFQDDPELLRKAQMYLQAKNVAGIF